MPPTQNHCTSWGPRKLLESSFTEKHPNVLAGRKLNTSQQHTLIAKAACRLQAVLAAVASRYK